jgi:hypothetical protein
LSTGRAIRCFWAVTQGRSLQTGIKETEPALYTLNQSERLCCWSADESGAIELCVDQHGRVVDVRIGRVEALRSRDALVHALREAYPTALFASQLNRSIAEGGIEAKATRGQELLEGRRRIQAPQLPRGVPIVRPDGPIGVPRRSDVPTLLRGLSRHR